MRIPNVQQVMHEGQYCGLVIHDPKTGGWIGSVSHRRVGVLVLAGSFHDELAVAEAVRRAWLQVDALPRVGAVTPGAEHEAIELDLDARHARKTGVPHSDDVPSKEVS